MDLIAYESSSEQVSATLNGVQSEMAMAA